MITIHVDKLLEDNARSYFGIVFKEKTGTFFKNQSGGVACMYPVQEGRLQILPWDNQTEKKLSSYFSEDLGGHGYEGLTDKQADKIDEILRDCEILNSMKVDRSLLDQSVEAWVHVRSLSLTGCPGGVLVFGNSD